MYNQFFVKSRIKLTLCLSAVLASAINGSCAPKTLKIIAAVNNEVITSKDIDDYCFSLALRLSEELEPPSCNDAQFRSQALERLIEDKIILTEAKREVVDVPQSIIEERLNKVISSYPSREAFEEALRERGLTVTALKNIIKEKILMQAIVEHRVKAFITVSPQEINDFYNKNKDSFLAPKTYMFYVAESDDYSTLAEIARAIEESGIDIVQKQYKYILFPVESSTKELRAEFAVVLERLKEKEHTIEKINDRYYFIYLVQIKPERTLSLEDARQNIQEYLKDIKFKKRFAEWLDQLKTTAVIKHYATP